MSALDNYPYSSRISTTSREDFAQQFAQYVPKIDRTGHGRDGGFFGSPFSLVANSLDIENFRGWPDLYTEPQRINKKFPDKNSPHQLWRDKFSTQQPTVQLRQIILRDPTVQEEKTFPLPWLKGIYQTAQKLIGRTAITILDIELRWGERLLAICGVGGEYLGFLSQDQKDTMSILSMRKHCSSALIFMEDFLQNNLGPIAEFAFVNNDLLTTREIIPKLYQTLQDGAYLAIQTEHRDFLPTWADGFHPLGVMELREELLDRTSTVSLVWWFCKTPPMVGKIFNLTIPANDKEAVLSDLYRKFAQLRWISTVENMCVVDLLSYNDKFINKENVARLWGSKDYVELVFRNNLQEVYERVRDTLFPLAARGSGEYITRAGDKLEEILNAAEIQPSGPIKFLDLAGAPGSFSQVLLGKNDKNQGWGMSLRGDIKWFNRLLNNSRDHRFHVLWGPRGTGDLLSRENASFIQNTLGKEDINYVVADGAIIIPGEENLQEYTTFPLLVAEAYIALTTLGQEGNFICKFFDMFNENTVGLIYILALCFQELLIVKPSHSRDVNSEKYLVGKKFQLFDKRIDFLFTTLEGVYVYASQGSQSSSILPITYQNFVQMVNRMNTYLLRQQINSLQKLAAAIQTAYNPQFTTNITIRQCQPEMDRVRNETYKGMF